MTHRRRGLLFAAASVGAALIAASAVAKHGRTQSFDTEGLRPVLVARLALSPGARIKPRDLEVRRFPAAYVPATVLTSTAQAVGERVAAEVPAGAYLLPALLGPERSSLRPRPRIAGDAGLTPVEIGVAGAGALRRSGASGGHVDVLVTRDSPRGLGGHTRVAVKGAGLLTLAASDDEAGEWTATLAVGRQEALRLIEAESYAREIRLIAAAH